MTVFALTTGRNGPVTTKGMHHGKKPKSITANSKFLAVFCYASLALGALTGFNSVRILAELFFWPSAPTGAYVAALLPNVCIAILALGVGLMVRYTLRNPHTYGASDTVIGKWKQW